MAQATQAPPAPLISVSFVFATSLAVGVLTGLQKTSEGLAGPALLPIEIHLHKLLGTANTPAFIGLPV
jgi:hypothetical protein